MNTQSLTKTIVQYRGYTISKAIVFDGAQHVVNGWDVSREPEGFYSPARTLADAKRLVRALAAKES
jgi:hypothetical protein